MPLKLKLRNGVWQAVGTIVCKDGRKVFVRKSTGHTFHEKTWATKKLSDILLETMQSEPKREDTTTKVVSDCIRLFLKRPDGVGKTDEMTLDRFERVFGRKELGKLTSLEVNDYLTGKGNKASSVRREMSTISACFGYARRMGMDVPDISLVKPSEGDGRCRWLDVDQRDQLIDAMPDANSRDVLKFLFFTGARLGECFNLRREDVLSGEVLLRTRKGKAKKLRTRRVPLHAEIKAMVEARAMATNGFVFKYNKRNTRRGSASYSLERWERDGFYDYFNVAKDKIGLDDFVPHDCRHTFASHLVQAGASLKAVAELLGHTSLAMVMRYAHLAPSHLDDTVSLLGVKEVSDCTNTTHEEGVVLSERIELSASSLPRKRSTTELRQLNQTIISNGIDSPHPTIDVSNAVDSEKRDALTKGKSKHPKNYTPDKE